MKKQNLAFFFIYTCLFILGIKALFHGFTDIERFFAEGMDERLTLTSIMKFGTLNFAPTIRMHPPLYHYFTFIPIGMFFILGKLTGFFHDKVEFVRFYFNNTHYFFLIGRAMSYLFYWLTAAIIFKIIKLFYSRIVAHITVLAYLLIPRFILDFSTTRPETLLFLNCTIFFYFFLKYYLDNKKRNLLLAAFFLGAATATKYNALFLGSIFIVLLLFQLKDRVSSNKGLKGLPALCAQICFLVFLGFFICNPFFIIQFKKYFYNFLLYTTVEMQNYWQGHQPAIFCLTHIRKLMSFMYINFFGFLILLFGSWRLLKKDKKLATIIFSTVLIYEIYFGIFQYSTSPMRYLNPILPIVALIFSSGIDCIITHRKKLISVLIAFSLILSYVFFDTWRQHSSGPTYIQRARNFIGQTIPEFTTICITSKSRLPQLNMTKESYYHLIDTAPIMENIPGHELCYKEMDNEENYDSIFRELRIKSLMKKPQYNLLRWNRNIKTEKEAIEFLKKNNVKYILGMGMPAISNRKLIDTDIISLVREFKSKKTRMYKSRCVYLYRVN